MSGKRTVLIVDDSVVMREMIRDTLEAHDFTVAGDAKDGAQAVEQYKSLKPDVVTMDIVMPNKHGIEAVKEIVAHDKKACIVIISGLFQKSLVMEALEAGARDYIIKPFEPAELVSTVKRNLT